MVSPLLEPEKSSGQQTNYVLRPAFGGAEQGAAARVLLENCIHIHLLLRGMCAVLWEITGCLENHIDCEDRSPHANPC